MTAVNALIPAGSTGYMLTDCAILEPDGKLQHVANKATSFPHSRTVMAVRGTVVFGTHLAYNLQYAKDFEEIEDGVAKCAREIWSGLFEEHRGDGAEVVLMGWSETRTCVVAALCRSADGFEPFLSRSVIAPGVQFTKVGGNTESQLLGLMQEQRLVYKKGTGAAVGGAAVLTTVTRHEITQRVIHRWQDRLYEPIKP